MTGLSRREGSGGPTAVDVPAAEWLKLRTVRSTWYVLAAVAFFVVLSAVFTLYVGSLWDGLPPEGRLTLRAARPEQIILMPVQICMAVLGVLSFTSEYATGMARTSFTVLPRRGVVLAARAAVVAAVAFTVGQASGFIAFFASRLIIGARPIPGFGTPLAQEFPKIFAGGLSVLVLAMVGLGAGAVLRSTAGAITAVVVYLYVLPRFVLLLPDPWNARIGSVLLEDLTVQAVGEPPLAVGLGDATAGIGLSPPAALAVMSLYVVVALAAAAVALTRRDV
ncbi:ABC transporter permease [Streptosporangium amethystogenes subsp. fukuiense]|uniref:ABC transporter permease n=1 Tax=Streptosporangium amethystogenes subsp. fukuiense TaxID=698418 RepID=A0ABW2SWT8_9ACTN